MIKIYIGDAFNIVIHYSLPNKYMGNTIWGTHSSETWLVLISQFTWRNNIAYDKTKLYEIAKLEIDYYNTMYDIVQYKNKHRSENSIIVAKKFSIDVKLQKFNTALYEYTDDKKYKVNAAEYLAKSLVSTENDHSKNEISNEPDTETIMLTELSVLDLIYGKKQCEYAMLLMERADYMVKLFPDTDALDTMNAICNSEFSSLVGKLKTEAVKDVRPCLKVLMTWFNYGQTVY